MNWYDYANTYRRLRKTAEETPAPLQAGPGVDELSPEDKELLEYINWRQATGRTVSGGRAAAKYGLAGAGAGALAGAGVGGFRAYKNNDARNWKSGLIATGIGAAGGGALGLLASLGRAAYANRVTLADAANDAEYQAWKSQQGL